MTSKLSVDAYHEPPWYRLFAYDFILWVFSIVFGCFFREIRPRGAFRIPKLGPVIFVGAPHANQFIDPMILIQQVKRESNRRISFLIAAASTKRFFIGLMSKCSLSIPVSRAQDNLIWGTGSITVDYSVDPLRVVGKGTKFTTECSVKGLVSLPQSLGASEIESIISDTELILRKEFRRSEKGVEMLKKGTRYKRADKVDQKHVYQQVFQHLSHGQCIGIFPEGGSHDRTNLLPLKAGVAIMALGAMDNDPACNVKIVPCGMNYFNAHKFRSRAVVEFGEPIEISRELVKKYANPETNRELVKELLDIISSGLNAVTVTCQDFDTLLVVQAARRLYAGNFAQYLPLPLVVEMNRRLVLGWETFQHEERIQLLKQRILHYNRMLQHLHLPDHHVEECDVSKHKITLIPVLLVSIVKLLFFVILALPGATLFSPVFIISKIISKSKAKAALANLTVKIKANDVLATWKILISMGIAPVVYIFYASIGTYYCYRHHILAHHNLWWIWLFLYMCGVCVTYAALITGEQGLDKFKAIRPLYLSITLGLLVRELKKLRNELSEEITDFVNEFGPKLFPDDFNLLDLKERLNIRDEVDYVDSDEEEDRKTQDVRRRLAASRKRQKREVDSLDSSHKHSSSVLDGISLMNSDNDLSNIPLFSDFGLHQNAHKHHFSIGDNPSTSLPLGPNDESSVNDLARDADRPFSLPPLSLSRASSRASDAESLWTGSKKTPESEDISNLRHKRKA